MRFHNLIAMVDQENNHYLTESHVFLMDEPHTPYFASIASFLSGENDTIRVRVMLRRVRPRARKGAGQDFRVRVMK